MRDKEIDRLIQEQCDNMATGTQMKEFLLNENGEEPFLREILRLNLEQFYGLIERKMTIDERGKLPRG